MKRKSLVIILALVAAAIAGGAVAALAGDSPPAATNAATTAESAGTDDGDTGSHHAEDEANETHDADDASEGPDQPITGPDLERASQVALDYVAGLGHAGARVTETEIEDEESYYEVEVTLANGKQIDVQLNEAFEFVGTD